MPEGSAADAHMRQGHAAMARGDPDGAVAHYRAAAEAVPAWAAARQNLGVALYRCGIFDQALNELHEAERLAPTGAETQFTIGLVHKDSGDYPGAEEHFTRSLELLPGYTQARYNRGICRFHRGTAGAAAEDFAQVVDGQPDLRDAVYNLIVALAADRQYARAEELLGAADTLPDPMRADLYCDLGMAYWTDEEMDNERAVGYFRRALEYDARHVEARYRLGLLYAREKYRDASKRFQALAELETLLARPDLAEVFPEPHRVYFAVATCYDDLPEHWGTAAELYARCLDLEPEFAPALNNLGVLRQKRGDIPGALALYREAVVADPDYGPAYHNLCSLYYDQPAEVIVRDFLELIQHAEARASCSRIMLRLLPALADVARSDAFATLYDHLHATKNLLGVLGHSARTLERELAEQAPELAASEHVAQVSDLQRQAFDNILEFLRVLRPPELQVEIVNLNEVAHRAALYVGMQDGAARVETDLAPNLPPIKGDPRRLREMIVNIVQNAVQASGSAAVCLRTTVAPSTWDPFGQSDAVWVVIRDTGSGIPAESLRDVLQPGYTTKESGSGFGLTIASQIAREHQGELRLDSREGEGTTVTIELPATTELRPGTERLRLRPVIFEDYRAMIQTELGDDEAAHDRELEIRP